MLNNFLGLSDDYNIETEDAILLTTFSVSTAVFYGLLDVVLFNGTSLQQTYDVGGFPLSVAFILGTLSLLGAYATNDSDLNDYKEPEKYLVVGSTIAWFIVYIGEGGIFETVQNDPIFGGVFTVVSLGGYLVVALR